ncbi:MAG: TetR/AcrR family transcriptional regulator [Brachybacterium sp.]|nr:TetR/AcrR family transcriptional regulator [Brachybacterium sp.]
MDPEDHSAPQSRRARQREASFAEIVATSRQLLAEDTDLSLRAVARRMGMTAPALYRYVENYNDLVDLVAFEIDRSVTTQFLAASARYDDDDPAGRLIAATMAFRSWAHRKPREFRLVFANPVADASCIRREMPASSHSCGLMLGMLVEIWNKFRSARPDLDDLPPGVREVVLEPRMPIDASSIPAVDRGVLWPILHAWQSLYGAVILEVFGHQDPRIISCGAMFVRTLEQQLAPLGLSHDRDRLAGVIHAELASNGDSESLVGRSDV